MTNEDYLKASDILDLVPCYVFWKDTQSVFLGCNTLFAQSVGLHSPSAIVGKTDYDLPWTNSESDRYREDDALVIKTGTPRLNIEEEQTLSDGSVITLLTNKVPIYNKGKCKVIGVLGVYQNITELKKAQIYLKEKVERAHELKTHFIEDMQHDLRTPAYGVAGGLLDVLQSMKGSPEEKKLALIYRSAKELYRLCLQVTDFDKVQRKYKHIIVKKFSLKQLVQRVIRLNEAPATMKGLQLDVSINNTHGDIIKGDSYRVERILINLVGNAIKFTEKGRIIVAVDCTIGNDNTLITRIAVKDTGIGITPEKLDVIYEPFSRIEPANQGRYRGLGLGLQVVKQFVSDLKGDIEVNSSPAGTQFYVTLPFQVPLMNELHEAGLDEFTNIDDSFLADIEESKVLDVDENTENTQTSKQTNDHGSCEVLLIEDDTLSAMVANNVLNRLACNVHVVATVREAKDILAKKAFNLILSDVGLPDGTGFDIARYVKDNPSLLNHDVPLFALTAHDNQSIRDKAKEAGFQRLWTKPLTEKNSQQILSCMQNVEKKEWIEQRSISWDFLDKYQWSKKEGMAMLNVVYKTLPRDIEAIEKAYEDKEMVVLKDILHKLQGGFTYVSLYPLEQATKLLYDAIHFKKGTQSIEASLKKFLQEAKSVLSEYTQLKES